MNSDTANTPENKGVYSDAEKQHFLKHLRGLNQPALLLSKKADDDYSVVFVTPELAKMFECSVEQAEFMFGGKGLFETTFRDDRIFIRRMLKRRENEYGGMDLTVRKKTYKDNLIWCSIESGKTELELVDTDVRELFKGTRDIFTERMNGKKITYTVDTSEVTDCYIVCDGKRIQRILLNLISNAFKFTPIGGSVSVRMIQTGASGGRGDYELRVKDSGIGMSPEFAANVFNAFERERSKTVSEIQGTGLGMAITKSLVELMGGTIRVETEKGKGTEFIINLSFDIAEPPAVSDSGEDDGTPDFSGKKLLLVEDNEINVEIAKMILSGLGFEIDVANNGKAGFEKVRDSAPGTYDVVLMDVHMPVMNGFEATSEIRKLDTPRRDIPIIAMSANAFAEDRREAEQAGMTDYLTKPINMPELIATLGRTLFNN